MAENGSIPNEGATIHNVRLDSQFTITANSTPEDPNLSWGAKGLLWYILTREKNWKVYVWQLSKIYLGNKKGNKKDAIQEILRELRDAGYVKYTKSRDEEGKWKHRYDVYPMPVPEFKKMTSQETPTSEGKPPKVQKKIPERDLPALDDPAPDNPALLPNTNLPSTDRTKKEIKESNTQNVHNSPSPQSRSNSIGSIPFQRKDFSIDYSDPALMEIIDLESKYIPYFRPEIVTRWIGKFGPSTVLETMKFFFHIKSTQSKPIPKPEAWMEVALAKKYSEVDKTCRENKEFAEKLKKTYRLTQLKINKRYCQDMGTGKDYYYNLPTAVFQQALQHITD